MVKRSKKILVVKVCSQCDGDFETYSRKRRVCWDCRPYRFRRIKPLKRKICMDCGKDFRLGKGKHKGQIKRCVDCYKIEKERRKEVAIRMHWGRIKRIMYAVKNNIKYFAIDKTRLYRSRKGLPFRTLPKPFLDIDRKIVETRILISLLKEKGEKNG